MKKAAPGFLPLAGFFAFLLACPPGLSPLSLELRGGAGNLAFSGSGEAPGSSGEYAFEPGYFPLALAEISGETDSFSFEAGFKRDPLERNRLFGNIKADLGYFRIGAGPFFGIANSAGLPVNPGVSAALDFSVPGVIFAGARGSSTLAFIGMEKEGRNFQYSGDLGAGFWVPHVICSLNASHRKFSYLDGDGYLTGYGLNRYFLRADVYTKNVPYTVKVDLGYQNLNRSRTPWRSNAGAAGTDVFKSIFMGLEATCTLNYSLKILIGGEMPVYSWAVRPMQDPPDSTLLFKAWAGIVWTFPS